MTKGGSGKPKMLGRLIFGDKRKQHASPSRQQLVTRNGTSMVDVAGSGTSNPGNKTPINYQDWAAWRTQLNEQMSSGATEQADLKQMRQFLHSNTFYQQHSRDPSNGRYNGVRLLFSIPHAKLKPELIDGRRRETNKTGGDTASFDQKKIRTKSHDRTATCVNTVLPESPMATDKTISQLLPKKLAGDTDGFLRITEQMIAAETARTRRSNPVACSSTDRVHSTLQKAVKDGNVLEKIKAFEMQAAAAAQAESTTKLSGGGNGSNHRIQAVTSPLQSTAHRALSPAMAQPSRHAVSPIPMQHDTQQQYIRSHRSRYVHPAPHRRDGNAGPMVGRESRKGAHVLEPAHGDIILKRRTPSQKTVNDEDYSMTAMSSIALTTSQGHQHRQQQYHPRTGTSRSRHRQEPIHDKRTHSHHENSSKKHQQKPKEPTVAKPSPTKPSKGRRWLKGRKETPTETATESVKQDLSTTKPNKNNKNKKKNSEKEKVELTKKPTSPSPKETRSASSEIAPAEHVPHTDVNEQTKSEATIYHQSSLRIEEENESDAEETTHISSKEVNVKQTKEVDAVLTTEVERRSSKIEFQQNLSNIDGEVLSKTEDDARFSRPTDDHAHRSELNDDDDECQSEGDVFLEEPSISPPERQSPKTTPCPIAGSPPERRWQWSKESGGLIDIGSRKKQQQQAPITIITRKNRINPEEEHVIYEAPQSEHTQASVSSTHTLKKKKKQPSSTVKTTQEPKMSKQILHAIAHQASNDQDDFFDSGPYTNPEETLVEKAT